MARYKRPLLDTVLAVGEGLSEVHLLRHLSALHVPRSCGVTVTVRDAGGKGAAQVIDYAASITRRTEYTRTLVLLDTDTDWTPAARAQAKSCASQSSRASRAWRRCSCKLQAKGVNAVRSSTSGCSGASSG